MAKKLAFVTTERTRIANLKCEDVVAVGRAPYTDWIGRMQDADKEIVARSLASVGMEAYAHRTMDKMSDGECQRIMIARALAQQTPVILLDEPTSFLDLPNRYELCSLLARLAHDEGQVHLVLHPRTRHRPCRSPTASHLSTRRSYTVSRRRRWPAAAISSGSSATTACGSILSTE